MKWYTVGNLVLMFGVSPNKTRIALYDLWHLLPRSGLNYNKLPDTLLPDFKKQLCKRGYITLEELQQIEKDNE